MHTASHRRVVRGLVAFLAASIILVLASGISAARVVRPSTNETSMSSITLAYIYATDTAAADRYHAFLEERGYPTTVLPLDSVAITNFLAYDLIIVGSDTSYGYEWGTPEAVSVIRRSGKPVLGLGFGGAGLFQALDLSINWGNGWISSRDAARSIYVVDPAHRIYQHPTPISVPRDRLIQLYESSKHIGEYGPDLARNVVRLGRESNDADHYPLVQEGEHILWGFTAAPDQMTPLGRDLFLNIIHHLAPVAHPEILYHADHGAGIWKMNDDGTNITQMTNHGWFARYSPDGSKIAFGEYYQNGIWVMNADGSGQQQLTRVGSAPTWSPDSRQIAYHVGGVEGTDRRIWVMNADGSNPRKLSETPGSFPRWSPDGATIAFHGEVNNGIWLIRPDGSGERLLYADGGYPAWSPDGTRIAYVSLRDWAIWTMKADATDHAAVTRRRGIMPDWSPDGARIAYEDEANDTGIWVVNRDGTDDHLVNEVGHAPDWRPLGQPELMPDLIVESISGPASATVGDALGSDIVLRIKNIGTAPAVAQDGYFHTDLVLSPDAVIGNTDDILLIGGRDQVSTVLAPGQSLNVSLAGSNQIPDGIAPGSYHLGAIVDSVGDHVAEMNEQNNTNSYTPLEIHYPPVTMNTSLQIEDAIEGVVVNKVVGDTSGPTHYTRLEIVTTPFTFDPTAKDAVSVILSIPGDLFGSPTNAWVRDTPGDPVTSLQAAVPVTNLGNGQYRVTTNLAQTCWGNICWYRKQIVWRFLIPNTVAPQLVTVHSATHVPARSVSAPHASGTIRIVAPGSLRTIIIANRTLLYKEYTDSQVTNLLRRLFTEAAGWPTSHSPTAAIYYVERYDGRARSWDNTAVNYSNATTANTTADAIDDLIEDWHEDASKHVTVLPGLSIPIGGPDYLLIVGDDNTIPFYRYDDPSNDEGVNSSPWCPNALGWCVDSATNPAIRATDEDYFFTDNPYADLWGGTDWQTGDLELWTGRLLGDSAADMLSLLDEGTSWSNGNRGGVVMASVDGWELGLEPDPGGSGHIADLHDVPALFRSHGFVVRNDDIPASEVRTIDVMSPFEGGGVSWNTAFRNAANAAGGMDIFFIGGHDSYDHASIPGDAFSPDDTCAAATCRYNRFDNDHPIALITGCHGGLPVPDIDVDGGVDHDMVYDLVHEGASAYIGATGFSYGSPGNLHACTFAERLLQRFFDTLLSPPGGNSMTIGKAMAEAKDDYVFGFGGSNALDRKTVTEFNVYGVPWTFIYYPSGNVTSVADAAPAPQAYISSASPIAQVGAETYTRTVAIDIADYTATSELVDGMTYDLLTIEGGKLAVADSAPILPYLEGYQMALPISATITGVQVVDTDSSDIGTHNIPIARVQPWSTGGMLYTTTTTINTPYPAELVQYQTTSDGVVLTVFPIQHNPTSDETVFYRRIEVEVTYEGPLALAMTEVALDQATYRPGEPLTAQATVSNIGATAATLTATLTIEDLVGQSIGSQTSTPVTVPPDGTEDLSLTWTGMLDSGAYRATLTIWEQSSIVAGDTAEFQVVAGEITAFTAPDTVAPGTAATFELDFANYQTAQVSATVNVAIYDAEGMLITRLAPVVSIAEANTTAKASLSEIVADVGSDSYTAVALVTVNEQVTYGPARASFRIGAPISLQSVSLSGPQADTLHSPCSFIATVAPADATVPVSYTWEAIDHTPTTHVGGLSDTMTLTWDTPGTKTVTVEATNSAGAVVTTSHQVEIRTEEQNVLYLPLIQR